MSCNLHDIKNTAAAEIAICIFNGAFTLEEVIATGECSLPKQREIRKELDAFKKEDKEFEQANSSSSLQAFIRKYPSSKHLAEAKGRLQQIQEYEAKEREDKLRREEAERIAIIERKRKEKDQQVDYILSNLNDKTAKQIKDEYGLEVLTAVCQRLNLDLNYVINYVEPSMDAGPIPQESDEVPINFTDIFFWGVPSSGKTTALSVLFRTMKDLYQIRNPEIENRFGAAYRESLAKIYDQKGWGYLFSRTAEDFTQYIPFLLRPRIQSRKWWNRRPKESQMSFFELSGEVVRYLYDSSKKDAVLRAMDCIDILLKHNNRKIHFFFIDYNRNIKADLDRLTQKDYIEAAVNYFRRTQIFKNKTDAIYIVVTKADELPGNNKDEQKEAARDFLNNNFAALIDEIKDQCGENSMKLDYFIFSIGSVYFSKLCKINYEDAQEIIEELLIKVRPPRSNWLTDFNQ